MIKQRIAKEIRIKEMEKDPQFSLWLHLTVGTMVEITDYYGRDSIFIVTNEDKFPEGYIYIELFEIDKGVYRNETLLDLETAQTKGRLTFIHEVKNE